MFLFAAVVSHASQSTAAVGPTTRGSMNRGAIRAISNQSMEGEGARVFETHGCRACHSLGGVGARIGPELDRVRNRKSRDEIIRWLDDPQRIKPGTTMPTFHFTPAQEASLADYLLAR